MWVFVCVARFTKQKVRKRTLHTYTHIHTPSVFLGGGPQSIPYASMNRIRTSNKLARCMWVFVCMARFGLFHLAKSAKAHLTHIHTYTHIVVFCWEGDPSDTLGSQNHGF